MIDDHIDRILRLADRVGSLGTVRALPTDLPTPDSALRREQLTRLAASGMTVLTNDGLLPLGDQTVALIGRHGIETTTMGGGSAQVNPPYQISVAEGLAAKLGDRLTVVDGVEVRSRPAPATGKVLTQPESGEPGLLVEIYAADGTVLSSQAAATAHALVGFDDDFAQPATHVAFRARTSLRGPVEIGAVGAGTWTLALGDRSESFELGNVGGIGAVMLAPPAEANVFDVSDTSDEIVATVRLETADDPANPLAGVGMFSLTVRPVPAPRDEVLAAAAQAAAAAEVAVVVVGLTEEQETEAVDKSTIALPGDQDALVTAVAAAAKRTVVVVNSATPVLMPWADDVDAILWAGLPGQEGGHAVAAALLGEIEPAGRLVTTFPVADGAAPAWEVVPTAGALSYSEGTAIGYRGHFAGLAPEPAFWLGHGLGYSTWSYDDATLVSGSGADSPTVQVTLTNTGPRDSRELVQVYLQPADDDQPVRLVGWATVDVPAGSRTEVQVSTDAKLWRRWDTSASTWGTPLTGGVLLVARGLGDIRQRLIL